MATIVVLMGFFQQCLAILPFASWFLIGLLGYENNAETHGYRSEAGYKEVVNITTYVATWLTLTADTAH